MALIPKKGWQFDIKDAEVAEPAAQEVLIRITATGLCHTYLAVGEENLPTDFPMVSSHEGSGVNTYISETIIL